MNQLRVVVMLIAAGFAFYRGAMLPNKERQWVAFGLGILAVGLAIWHMFDARRLRTPPRA